MHFDGIDEFKGIAEYDFYLTNYTAILDGGSMEEIFLKTIKKGKIKESLFCICNIISEKYLKQYYSADNNSTQKKKISIVEEKNPRNINKVNVKLFEKDFKEEKAKLDIYFIEEKDIEQQKNKKKKRGENIEIDHNDIVIVGVKNIH